MRRRIRASVLAGAAICLAGCGTNSDQARYANMVWRLITGQREEVSREQAGAIPFASIGVTIGSSDEGLMVLGSADDERQDWYARTQMIATSNGRILRTQGFPYNLSRLEVRGRDGRLAQPAGAPAPGTEYSLVVDFQDLRLIGAGADCRSADAGEETIEILGAALATRHVVESCRIEAIDWSFENEFWVDPDSGFIWQSSQYVHPKLSPLTVRVLRPPA